MSEHANPKERTDLASCEAPCNIDSLGQTSRANPRYDLFPPSLQLAIFQVDFDRIRVVNVRLSRVVTVWNILPRNGPFADNLVAQGHSLFI
jgi:hypothetical protein